jgi:hypothetical protein
MNTNRFIRKVLMGALGLTLSLWVAVAWAQRPLSGKFDLAKKVELSGIVTKVDWRNPQVHIFLNVKNGAATTNWAIEIDSPSLLEMDGWNGESLRPGEAIVVKGSAARDGSRQVWGEDVRYASNSSLVFPRKLKDTRTPLVARPTPRWPDGHPALGALPGTADGYWADPSKTALVEDGVNVKMTDYGLLANLDDASKVAPMQPWALALYRNRQSRQLHDDPLFLNCKPPGGPRQYQSPLGLQLMEDRAHQRIFVLLGSGNHNYRIIYMDGRKQVGLVTGDDDNPLYYGRSAGRWDGDALVVDVAGFNEDFWFTQGGLPHTDQLHLTERFTRTDFDTLHYDVRVDDPGAYTRPWSASWNLKWNGGASLPVQFCQNNRQ